MANLDPNVIQYETKESEFDVRNVLPESPDPEDTGDRANGRRVLELEAARAYVAFKLALVQAYARYERHEERSHGANAEAMEAAAGNEG